MLSLTDRHRKPGKSPRDVTGLSIAWAVTPCLLRDGIATAAREQLWRHDEEVRPWCGKEGFVASQPVDYRACRGGAALLLSTSSMILSFVSVCCSPPMMRT